MEYSVGSTEELSPAERELRDFMNSPAECSWLFTQANSMLQSAGIYSGAEDLVQETFYRAYKGIHSFRGQSRLSTWLYRILANNFKNHLRSVRAKKTQTGLEPEIVGDILVEDKNEASFHEMEDLLKNTFRMLEEKQKIIFILCIIHQLKYSEAAEKLGLNVTQVRGHLYRARRNIRKALADYLPPSR